MRTLRFEGCVVDVWDDIRYLETRFPDQTTVPARPNNDPTSIARAQSLGYGGDTWRMSREHEILHAWLAEKLGHEYSATLWGVAHGQYPPRDVWQIEEGLVLAFQAYLHVGMLDPSLSALWDAGHDPAQLAKEARAVLADEPVQVA